MTGGPMIPHPLLALPLIRRALPGAALLLGVLLPTMGRAQPPVARPSTEQGSPAAATADAATADAATADAATAAVNATLARQPKRKKPLALTAPKPDAARAKDAAPSPSGGAAPRRSAAAKGRTG